MTRNNVYKVPDGFFESVQAKVGRQTRRITLRRRRVAGVLGTALLLAVVVVLGLHSGATEEDARIALSDQYIIESYEADIFLNVFEY